VAYTNNYNFVSASTNASAISWNEISSASNPVTEYCLENTQEKEYNNHAYTTQVLLQANFAPKKLKKLDGGTVDVGDCIASVSGQAMAAGEAWDGKLEVEDYTTRFAIGGGLDVNGFRESLSMQMKETVNRGFEVYFAERAGISGFCRPVEMEGV